MKVAKIIPLIFILISGAAFSYDRHVYRDAMRFVESARQVSYTLNRVSRRSHLSHDIYRVLQKARHLKYSARDEYASRHLQKDFRSLQRSYYRFLRNFRRSGDMHHYRRLRRVVGRMKYRFYSLRNAIYHSHGRGRRQESWGNSWF